MLEDLDSMIDDENRSFFLNDRSMDNIILAQAIMLREQMNSRQQKKDTD